MKLINKLTIAFVLITLGLSCSKTLDVDPTSVITTNSFWKTEDDANGALRGMYIRRIIFWRRLTPCGRMYILP